MNATQAFFAALVLLSAIAFGVYRTVASRPRGGALGMIVILCWTAAAVLIAALLGERWFFSSFVFVLLPLVSYQQRVLAKEARDRERAADPNARDDS